MNEASSTGSGAPQQDPKAPPPSAASAASSETSPAPPETSPAPPEKSDDAPQIPVLAEPSDGVPPVVDTSEALDAAVASLAGGTGAVAVDAERAQGFRYSARAYLLQFRRAGSGTHLIDPIPFSPQMLDGLRSALSGATWIIHAASQDLPCLAELDLVPDRLFDTELAGRLLGMPKVNLGALIEQYFGVRLLKEHSAANWSNRPIPPEWLTYAALDVELLVELAERLREDLAQAGKLEWAYQEFEALRLADWTVRVDPERWRRTSGLHGVQTRMGLAIVREMWRTRDDLARELDLAPGRLLHDQAITDLAMRAKGPHPQVPPASALRGIEGFRRRQARRWEVNWQQALERVRALAPDEFPPLRAQQDGPPAIRSWQHRDPAAWGRWNRVRPAVNEVAQGLSLAPENLISPDSLRRLAWRPPLELDTSTVDAQLAEYGVRPWQREHLVPLLVELLSDPE